MKNFKDFFKENKVLCIAVPVIVIILIILLCVFLPKKNTLDTKDVQTTNQVSNKDISLDVETVEKAEPVEEVSLGTSENSVVKETEKEVKEEPKEEVKVDNATDSVEVMAPVVDSNVDSEATVGTADEDELFHTWNKKATWYSSTYDVTLKINDAYADIDFTKEPGSVNAIYQEDSAADWSPNSNYMHAIHEFCFSSDPAYKNGADRYNPEVVKVSDLPAVSTVSSKQSSIAMTPELTAYKAQYDRLALFQATGSWEGSSTFYQLQINSDFAGAAVQQGYCWDIRKQSDDSFKISIYRNLSELDFNGLLTVLKMITPDAQAVYDAVYEQFYYGADWIVDYDNYYIIPNSNSEIMVPSNSEYAVYYIK